MGGEHQLVAIPGRFLEEGLKYSPSMQKRQCIKAKLCPAGGNSGDARSWSYGMSIDKEHD